MPSKPLLLNGLRTEFPYEEIPLSYEENRGGLPRSLDAGLSTLTEALSPALWQAEVGGDMSHTNEGVRVLAHKSQPEPCGACLDAESRGDESAPEQDSASVLTDQGADLTDAELSDGIAAFAAIGRDARPSSPAIPLGAEGGGPAGNHHQKLVEARVDPSGQVVLWQTALRRYPEPTSCNTRHVWLFGGLTIARHHLNGVNRYGENAEQFPFCLVNLPAWRRTPSDLHAARWFRSEQDAVEWVQPKPLPLPPPPPEPPFCNAVFPGGIEIELRRENGCRWLMWETRYGKKTRRKDFASPSLEHAKSTAEHWYGVPLSGWSTSDARK